MTKTLNTYFTFPSFTNLWKGNGRVLKRTFRMTKKTAVSTVLLCFAGILSGQSQRISGIVTNTEGDPLPGAAVFVKGTSSGTSTDTDGIYALDVPADRSTLVFTFLGYAGREVAINGRTRIDVQLEELISDLDKVIVVGFGAKSKRRITSAIASIGTEAFENIPVPDFQNALQGRLPGVVFSNTSGASNSGSSIRVRGVGSISAGNQPLVVVDGLILSGRNTGGTFLGFGRDLNPFINLNPNDIASVEVLKDAAAAAIYGARGANGVILITTKRGSFDTKPKVSIGYSAGFMEPSAVYDMLTGPEFARLWNQAAENAAAGYTREANPELFYSNPENEPTVDWFDLTTRIGFMQQANASVSGGTRTTRFYIGGTAKEEENFMRNNDLKRYSVRLNIDQLLGEKVTVGLSVNPSIVRSTRPGWWNNPYYTSAFLPNVEALDENGDPIGGINCNSRGDCQVGTPLSNLLGDWSKITSTQILLNTYLSYTPLKNLTLRTEFSTELTQLEELIKYSADSWFGFPSGYGSAFFQRITNYNWTSLATWQNTFGSEHDLDVSAGFNLTRESLSSLFLDGTSFADERLNYLGAAAQVLSHSTGQTDVGFLGFLGRVNYAFQNKYLLSLSARYDGASRFGRENRFGFFPAVSGGWIISEEDFFGGNGVDFLKLRSSFGIAGNAEIGDFASRGLVQFQQNYLQEPGYAIRSIENDRLGWEKNVQWDIGLEFGFLDNRLQGSLGYYIKDTKDLLLQAPVPATNGITTISQNAGEVRNQGFEFNLTAELLRGPFTWTLQLQGATLKNEVRKLADNDGDGVDDDIYTDARFLYRPGESIGTFYLVEYAGVDPENGDALFWDAERKQKLPNATPSANRRIVGKALPGFTGGFSSAMRYKGFDLSAFFQFKTGYQIYSLFGNFDGPIGGTLNATTKAFDAWSPDNRDTDIPQGRLYENNGSQRSSRRLSEADHLRLKNLQFGYTFSTFAKSGATLRLYVSGQNLLLFSKYRDLEPDGDTYQPESADQGATLGNQPLPRIYMFGANLNF